MQQHLDYLGRRATDRITGFTGVITSVCFDLYGCIQAIVNPGLKPDGSFGDANWFDISRLQLSDEPPVMPPPTYDWTPQTIASGGKGPAEKPHMKQAPIPR